MTTPSEYQPYYVPHDSKYPIWTAFSLILVMSGLGYLLNQLKADESVTPVVPIAGFLLLAVTLYFWFSKVIRESDEGLPSRQMNRSYVWGMGWFIFSEVMFFAAFFGALFYVRSFAVPWLSGLGDKAFTGEYLWPDFVGTSWPVLVNPDPVVKPGPENSMASPGISNWGNYLPFWNTVILLASSVTIHFAHTALKAGKRSLLNIWMLVTAALGVFFLILQVEEYIEAYQHLGLTLNSGIYGSTFFLLTGFHGFHVTLGTFMLIVIGLRCWRGHFSADKQFGFEAVSWYWHFVDVVWLGLFTFVYVL